MKRLLSAALALSVLVPAGAASAQAYGPRPYRNPENRILGPLRPGDGIVVPPPRTQNYDIYIYGQPAQPYRPRTPRARTAPGANAPTPYLNEYQPYPPAQRFKPIRRTPFLY